jgi:hypothetical protein
MAWINKKWFYLIPLILLLFVPIKFEGIDKTFWIFSLDFTSLGEQGIRWHYHAVRKYMNRQYFFYELIIACAYLISLGSIRFLKGRKGRVAKNQ